MKNFTKTIFTLSILVSTISVAQTATTTSPSRSARSVNATTPATSSRSARSTAIAPSATSARSARSTAVQSTATSARSARSATTPTAKSGARSARQTVQSVRTTTVVNPTATTRAAVSRAGISNISTATTTTATTTTSTTTPINYAALIPTEVATTGKTAEEVATLIANETSCKEHYVTCMDQFCADTVEDSMVGRCLCSGSISAEAANEKELAKILANITQMNWQIKNLTTAKAQADAEGKDFAIVLKEVTEEGLEELGVSGSTESISDDDVLEVFSGNTSSSSKRKEGNAKLKEAQTACKTMLEICPASKTQIESTYSILAGNDCRVYSKDLEKKISENKVVLQNTYNKYQITETEYSLSAKNKYNSEECGIELNRCMATDQVCGDDLEYCYSDAELEARKPLCQSVLNQCQGVNMPTLATNEKRTDVKTDVLWKSFKKSVLAKTQLTNQQCFTQSKACVISVCGDNYANCTSGTFETKGQAGYLKDIKAVAGVQCSEIIKKCAGDTTDVNGVWESIINGIIIRDTYTDQNDQLVSNNLYTCMAGTSTCGDANYSKCTTNAKLESVKSICAQGLMTATRNATIWANFKSQVLTTNGKTSEQCVGDIKTTMIAKCGTNYSTCRTDLDSYKASALVDSGVAVNCDFHDQDGLWVLAKADMIATADAVGEITCTAAGAGSYYVNGACTSDANYSACTTSGGTWTQSTKVCTCTATESSLQGTACVVNPVYTACLTTTGKTWNSTTKTCN